MHLDTTIIHQYLHDLPLADAPLYEYVKNKSIPDPKRKDVVVELHQRLCHMVEYFPLFNHDVFHQLFTNFNTLSNSITLVLCVGEANSYTYKYQFDDQLYIFIDLLLVANFTRYLDEMEYILNNDITKQIALHCIEAQHPLTSHNYSTLLNHFIYRDGLANWLAWNHDIKEYKFQSDNYEEQKAKSFGMLAHAYELEDPRQQQMILLHLMQASFWDKFTSIAGMFYIDDCYHTQGIDGVLSLYQQGDERFIDRIFQTI